MVVSRAKQDPSSLLLGVPLPPLPLRVVLVLVLMLVLVRLWSSRFAFGTCSRFRCLLFFGYDLAVTRRGTRCWQRKMRVIYRN